jgi:TPR repeat protein
VQQNYTLAAKWYRKAAEQGHARAQTNLALMYEDGEGVPQNRQEAIRWFKKAAAQGEEKAVKGLVRLGN